MKTIDNKTTDIFQKINNEEIKMTYQDLLKVILNIPPATGYSITEMRQRLKIFSELAPNELTKINLEDADFSVVKKCVLDFKWAYIHADIVLFVDYIESIK